MRYVGVTGFMSRPEDLRVREWPRGFTPPKSKALPVLPEVR